MEFWLIYDPTAQYNTKIVYDVHDLPSFNHLVKI